METREQAPQTERQKEFLQELSQDSAKDPSEDSREALENEQLRSEQPDPVDTPPSSSDMSRSEITSPEKNSPEKQASETTPNEIEPETSPPEKQTRVQAEDQNEEQNEEQNKARPSEFSPAEERGAEQAARRSPSDADLLEVNPASDKTSTNQLEAEAKLESDPESESGSTEETNKNNSANAASSDDKNNELEVVEPSKPAASQNVDQYSLPMDPPLTETETEANALGLQDASGKDEEAQSSAQAAASAGDAASLSEPAQNAAGMFEESDGESKESGGGYVDPDYADAGYDSSISAPYRHAHDGLGMHEHEAGQRHPNGHTAVDGHGSGSGHGQGNGHGTEGYEHAPDAAAAKSRAPSSSSIRWNLQRPPKP